MTVTKGEQKGTRNLFFVVTEMWARGIVFVILFHAFLSQAQNTYTPPINLHLAVTGDPTQMVVSWMTTCKYL